EAIIRRARPRSIVLCFELCCPPLEKARLSTNCGRGDRRFDLTLLSLQDQPRQVIANIVDLEQEAEQQILSSEVRTRKLVQVLGCEAVPSVSEREQLRARQRCAALRLQRAFLDARDLRDVLLETPVACHVSIQPGPLPEHKQARWRGREDGEGLMGGV